MTNIAGNNFEKKHDLLSRGSAIWSMLLWNIILKANIIQKEMELKMDRLAPKILQQKYFSHKCQFFTKLCASSRLISQVQDMGGKKEKKVPDLLDSNQNIRRFQTGVSRT